MTPELTKREHFAGLAMQGILANKNIDPMREDGHFIYQLCNTALNYADELIRLINQNIEDE